MKIKYWIGVVAAAALIGLARHFNVQELLSQTLSWIEGLGFWGPVVFILIYIVACVFLISGAILSMGAGAVFGVLRGSVYVSIASTLGGTAAFLIGRYWTRDWVSKKIAGNEKFKAIDDGVAREGWKIVLLTRLSPVFPFTLLNYAYGLTRVSLKDYFLASWIGMIPGTILYVYLGSLAGNIAALGAGQGHGKTPAEWAFYGIGLLATLIVTLYITRIARQALIVKEKN